MNEFMKTQPQYVKNCQCLVQTGREKIKGCLLIKETTEFFKYWKLLGFGELKVLLILVCSKFTF